MSDKIRTEFHAWVQDRGCDTDGAWSAWQAAWLASRKQAMEEAAAFVEAKTLRRRQVRAWANSESIEPCEIASAIRAEGAGEGKE